MKGRQHDRTMQGLDSDGGRQNGHVVETARVNGRVAAQVDSIVRNRVRRQMGGRAVDLVPGGVGCGSVCNRWELGGEVHCREMHCRWGHIVRCIAKDGGQRQAKTDKEGNEFLAAH